MPASHGWLLAAFVAAFLFCASPALAVDCVGLQQALDTSSLGDTVTIDAGSVCRGPFTLPSHAITLEGGGTGATIDGNSQKRALLGADVGATTIRNLVLSNGHASGPGGAISISGDSVPKLDTDLFYSNSATGDGGAVYVESSATNGSIEVKDTYFGDPTRPRGSTGTRGGGLFVDAPGGAVTISNSRFYSNRATAGSGGGLFISAESLSLVGNVVTSNSVGGSGDAHGGGAYLAASGAGTMTLSGNTFFLNDLGATTGSQFGAGLDFDGPAAALTQDHNQFIGNVSDLTGSSVPDQVSGGGEAVNAASFSSLDDRYSLNSLAEGRSLTAGGGLALRGCDSSSPLRSATLTNAMVVANTTRAAGASGVGVYADCGSGTVALNVFNSTITANSGGGTAGLYGGSDDALQMRNSIATPSAGGGVDISGFAHPDVTFSDVCGNGVALEGDGNVCFDPKLRVADGAAPETPDSQTIDLGRNADVPTGLTRDFADDPRVSDGDRDGLATVDMGADEAPFKRPAPVNAVPVVPADAPQPEQIVAGVRATAPASKPAVKARRCGDHTGPTSRFLNRLSNAARFNGSRTVLVLKGVASFKRCRKSQRGKIKLVRFTIKLVTPQGCQYLTRKHTLGPVQSCRLPGRLFIARGTTRWSFAIRGPLPVGRYLAQVQATDTLGNRERPSSHRNFRHFRVTSGALRQGWHGAHPDDYTVRG